MVLFLFVVMMLDINVDGCARDSGSYPRSALAVGGRDDCARDGAGAVWAACASRNAQAGDARPADYEATPHELGILMYTRLPLSAARSPR